MEVCTDHGEGGEKPENKNGKCPFLELCEKREITDPTSYLHVLILPFLFAFSCSQSFASTHLPCRCTIVPDILLIRFP